LRLPSEYAALAVSVISGHGIPRQKKHGARRARRESRTPRSVYPPWASAGSTQSGAARLPGPNHADRIRRATQCSHGALRTVTLRDDEPDCLPARPRPGRRNHANRTAARHRQWSPAVSQQWVTNDHTRGRVGAGTGWCGDGLVRGRVGAGTGWCGDGLVRGRGCGDGGAGTGVRGTCPARVPCPLAPPL